MCVYNFQSISLAHILVPIVLMVVLGLMHAQIIATRDSHKSKRQTPKARKYVKHGIVEQFAFDV